MSITVYGIPNCDTVKKARRWLDGGGLVYEFHDYRKRGVEPDRLARWAEAEGWQALLNRRGTTFRRLSDEDRGDLHAAKAIRLMIGHPSLIKRPVVEYARADGEGLLLGFDEQRWSAALT